MSSSRSPALCSTPPRAPPVKYAAPHGTRWEKEKAAAGGTNAFDLPTDPKFIGPWIIGECIGKGASGRVKIAKHRVTGQLAAVKILPLAPLVNSRINATAEQQAKTEKQRLGIDREITMMKLMNHPNILRIYDVYEGTKELYLVLEYVEGGELFDFLVNRGKLSPADAQAFFKQIILGLNYAHTFSIIHRDLKPENILIASLDPPLIKIADWGMAAFAPPTLQLETSCGSPHYASPEIVNGERYQGNATDIWSCGVILFALLTGRLPFDDKNVKALLAKVKVGKYELPPWVDPMARDLLQKMLVVDSKKRIMIPDILLHPWLTAAFPPARTSSAPFPNPIYPPSPSTLARPIASPSLIDPVIFASLCVIWGRHTDKDGGNIRKDLLSPEGEGTHAKAFYFLLGKFREEQEEERDAKEGTANDQENCDTKGASKGLGESLTFNLGWELPAETVRHSQHPRLRSCSAQSPCNSRFLESKSPTAVVQTSLTPRKASFEVNSVPSTHRRGSTHSSSNSAGSPPASDATREATSSTAVRSTHPQLQRAKTHWPRQRNGDATASTQPLGGVSTAAIISDKAVTASNRPINQSMALPCPAMNDEPPRLPLLTELEPQEVRGRAVSVVAAAGKPCVLSKDLESANGEAYWNSCLDSSENKPESKSRNRATSLAAGNREMSLPLETLNEVQQPSRSRAPSLVHSGDKENARTSGNNKNGKVEDASFNAVRRSLALSKKTKLRPPPLDFPFPTLARKRSTIEVAPSNQPLPLGSRSQQVAGGSQNQYQSLYNQFNCTPTASTSKSPLISPKFPPLSFSPITGPGSPKTPGWLSNLFSGWKLSSGEEEMRMSSFGDVQRTKADIVDLLEQMGVDIQIAAGSGAQQYVVLKCGYRERVVGEDTLPVEEGMGNLKPARFRVEIFTRSSVASYQFLSPPISPLLSPPLGCASTRTSCDAPSASNASSPVTGSYFLQGAGPRSRSTTSPLPSPMLNSKLWGVNDVTDGNPPTVVVMRHEKGSNVTSRVVWRKIRDAPYGSVSHGIPGLNTGWTPSPGWVVVDGGKA